MEWTTTNFLTDMFEDILELDKDDYEYLHKEEIVTSLVRKRRERSLRCGDSVYDTVFSSIKKFDRSKLVKRVAKVAVEPVLKDLKLEGLTESELNMLISEKFPQIDRAILQSISFVPASEQDVRDVCIITKKQCQAMCVHSIGCADARYLLFYDRDGRATSRSNGYQYNIRTGIEKHISKSVYSAPEYVASLLVLSVVIAELRRIQKLDEKERKSDVIWGHIHESLMWHTSLGKNEEVALIKDESMYDLYDFFNLPAVLVTEDVVTDRYWGAYWYGKFLYKSDFVRTCVCCSYVTKDYECLSLLEKVYHQYVLDKACVSYEKERSGYALSYMTKANIPKTHQKYMETSGFNATFGYVEVDELCELDKVSELEREFEALKPILCPNAKFETALRFRRLGNHKAAGLYYPSVDCICVDIRCPSSFTHELFHMIDSCASNMDYSRSREFLPIYNRYCSLFDDATSEVVLKGKYDSGYYKTPTEVFARCGELYVSRICGVRNSLCCLDAKSSFAYPEDKELYEWIEEYYRELLFKLFGQEVSYEEC